MDFSTMEIGGVAIPALVLGWVAAAKELGLKGKRLTMLAIGLSTLCAGLWQALMQGLIPLAAVPWITVIVTGLGGGVALTGWYDLTKRAGTSLIAAISTQLAGRTDSAEAEQ